MTIPITIRNVSPRALGILSFLAILGITWVCYAPGFSGSFLFDDLANLPSLGAFGPVDNWQAFFRYITSGFADPTGRPLALLSFLIDAHDWPADPLPFKRTSTLLHLINGCLLFWLLAKLGHKARLTQRKAILSALLGASMWLLHPLWISTTLYVVQREAMLPATFVLLGLLGYLYGRDTLAQYPARGSAIIFGSVASCTLLAFLSKANGLLLPLFVVVVEHVFLRSLPSKTVPAGLKVPLRLLIYPLAGLLVAYLLYALTIGFVHGAPIYRSWTYEQRLLTEPRVIVDYLYLLLIPRPYSRGLFNDDFQASIDFLHPWTTLPSIALLACLMAFALAFRTRFPAFALAVVFYFAGHMMESTTIPLELYFEHRNYLPAAILFWPFAIWLTTDGALERVKPLIAAAALILLSVETFVAAKLWGNSSIQALVWAAQNPDSPRAQTYASSAERALGYLPQAEARLRNSLKSHPDEIQLAINLIGVRCELGTIAPSDMEAAENALRIGSARGPLAFDWISESINLAKAHECAGLTLDNVGRLIDATWQNAQTKDSKGLQQDLFNLEAQLALARGDNATGIKKFASALKISPKPDVALKQAAILGANSLPMAGLHQLDMYGELASANETPPYPIDMKSFHAWLLVHDGYWENEISHLHATLEADAIETPDSHPNKDAEAR
jgi:protein O-mannosyl-transferase